MTLQQIDRWLLNVTFFRSRIFQVELADCMDEFGKSFGANGTHFFIRALAKSENETAVFDYLKDYYASNPLRSFNDMIGADIGHPAGDQYFCPWEAGRVRPLLKFVGSHKAGPTPDTALKQIVHRLLNILTIIRKQGFRQFTIIDGFPRVIGLRDISGRKRYIIRDGQHRTAALSHLGRETMWVTYLADHWIPSWSYRMVSHMLSPESSIQNYGLIREVREDAAHSWPHVLKGTVTQEEALAYFHATFGNANKADASSMEAEI